MVSYMLYKLKRISDKQHPCLTPLAVFTILVSSRSSFSLTLCPFFFHASQYQFTLGSALIWPSLHSQMQSASL